MRSSFFRRCRSPVRNWPTSGHHRWRRGRVPAERPPVWRLSLWPVLMWARLNYTRAGRRACLNLAPTALIGAGASTSALGPDMAHCTAVRSRPSARRMVRTSYLGRTTWFSGPCPVGLPAAGGAWRFRCRRHRLADTIVLSRWKSCRSYHSLFVGIGCLAFFLALKTRSFEIEAMPSHPTKVGRPPNREADSSFDFALVSEARRVTHPRERLAMVTVADCTRLSTLRFPRSRPTPAGCQ